MTRLNDKPKGRKRAVLAAACTVTLLVVLAWKAGVRFDEIGSQLRTLNWAILAGALVFSALWHLFLGSDKWWRILRALGAQVSFWEVFRVRLGSDPIRFAMPLKSGEVVNAAYFAKLDKLEFSRAAGSIVFDKSLNFFGTLFWLYVGAAAMVELPTVGYLGLHSAIGAAVLVMICSRSVRQTLAALAGRLHAKLGRFAVGVLSAFEELSPVQKVGFLVYGIIFQLRPLTVCWLMLVASPLERLPPLPEMLALGSVVVLMSNIPSVGGIGPREAALMGAFANYADPKTLLSAGLLMSFCVQVFPAILGIPFMFPLLRALTPSLERKRSSEASASSSPCDLATLPEPD